MKKIIQSPHGIFPLYIPQWMPAAASNGKAQLELWPGRLRGQSDSDVTVSLRQYRKVTATSRPRVWSTWNSLGRAGPSHRRIQRFRIRRTAAGTGGPSAAQSAWVAQVPGRWSYPDGCVAPARRQQAVLPAARTAPGPVTRAGHWQPMTASGWASE